MYTHSGVCHIGITDHSIVYVIRKLCIPKGKPKIVEARQFRNFDTGSFRADLCLVPRHLVKLEDNPNSAWEIWSSLFLEICDSHAPKRKRKIRNNFAPWLTPELKRLMFERNKLKRAAIINKSEVYWAEYKTARNNVNANIKKAKINYYQRYFETNLGDTKKSWRRVNLILGRNLPATEISRIDAGDITCTTPIEISNGLNSHFTQIGSRLASNIPQSSNCFEDYIMPLDCTFTLKETHCGDVQRLISSLQVNRAAGWDGISVRLLKEAGQVIVPSLTYIISLSIRSGYFPNKWKVSKVLPIYKDDIKSDPNSYRPISILPIVSKIIEKVIFNQLYEYLISNNLLADVQHGFRPMHSTLTALLEATNNWYLNIDNGLINSVLFLDLKKAFDTVDHSIL